MAFDPIDDPAILEGYLTDASNLRGHAEALVRPSDTAEVAAVLRHCQAAGIPLTVTGGRTSTTAAPVPFGGWLLSTEHLDAVESIGADRAVAQSGVRLGHLQDEVESQGRFFPPDPTSRHDCTLGAAIACNASGARSFKYGPTRPWIEALEVVLPTGDVREVRRGEPLPEDWPAVAWNPPAVKTAAGYGPADELIDLFIGQEGTLGVVTRAELRLIPLPGFFGLLAWFPDRETAVAFVEQARAAARADRDGLLSPRCLEYLDHHCLDLARERVGGVPDGARAALFCEQELSSGDAEDHLEAWWPALEGSGALADDTLVALDPPSQAALHALRHAVPAGVNETVVRNGMPKVGTDLSVPDAALSTMMERYEAAPLEHVLFGHIGDNHLHLNLLPRTEPELARARAFYDDLARTAIALGGSVSAEHGIGKLKRHQLEWMLDPDVLDRFRALKRHLDPAWVLGRGNLLAVP